MSNRPRPSKPHPQAMTEVPADVPIANFNLNIYQNPDGQMRIETHATEVLQQNPLLLIQILTDLVGRTATETIMGIAKELHDVRQQLPQGAAPETPRIVHATEMPNVPLRN